MNGGGAVIIWVIYLAVLVFFIAAHWKIFTKAGEAGWQSIIPIWNIIVLLRIVGRQSWAWWLLLFLIPPLGLLVWIVLGIIVCIDLAKSFGRGSGFAVGIIFLPWIFLPILGFGSATYVGPAASSA